MDRFLARLNSEKLLWTQFTHDDRWLLFGSGKQIVVWDWRRNQMASDRIPVNDLTRGLDTPWEALLLRRACLSPDGDRLLWQDRSRPMISDIAPSTEEVPDWLYPFVESYSGLQFNDDGDLHASSFELIEQLRETSQGSNTGDDLARWRRWLFADRTTRAVSPSASITGRNILTS